MKLGCILLVVCVAFRAMFTDAMKEANLSEIELNGVGAMGLKHVLDYAYTSKLTLTLGVYALTVHHYTVWQSISMEVPYVDQNYVKSVIVRLKPV